MLQEQEEWRRVRAGAWINMCGFSDPKKLPKNMIAWWSIGDEQEVTRPQFDKDKIKKAIQREKGGKR